MKTVSRGLIDFQMLELRGDPMTWPKLSIAADQGSDILSGIFALQRHYKINLDYTSDVSHGAQND